MAGRRRLIGSRAVHKDTPKLMLTPMIDMFTILLVFLLMSYGVTQIQIRQSSDLQLPESTSRQSPKLAVSVVVSKKAIFVDNKKILDLGKGYKVPRSARQKNSYVIKPLLAELTEIAKKAKAIVKKSKRGDVFEGDVIIQGDRSMPFTLLRDIMFTAGQAEFSNFRFLVLKKSEG